MKLPTTKILPNLQEDLTNEDWTTSNTVCILSTKAYPLKIHIWNRYYSNNLHYIYCADLIVYFIIAAALAFRLHCFSFRKHQNLTHQQMKSPYIVSLCQSLYISFAAATDLIVTWAISWRLICNSRSDDDLWSNVRLMKMNLGFINNIR